MDRLYEPEGFTDCIIEALRGYVDYTLGTPPNYLHLRDLPAEMLLAVAEKLPNANLEDRRSKLSSTRR